MEAPKQISVEEIAAQEKDRLREVNELLWERAQKEWRMKRWSERTLREAALAMRATVIDVYIDLVEKRKSVQEAIVAQPDRWLGLGLFLFALGLLVYVIDLLG